MEASELKSRKIPPATILTVVVAFLSGGLAGSIFTWYVNRPQPTIVTYGVSTTSLGTSEVASIVPELKLQIGNESISSLYSHTVDLAVAKGPFVDQTTFGITFPATIRVFGIRTVAPSSVQTITCDPLVNGFKCSAGPLSAKVEKPFRVIIATSEQSSPVIQSAARNVDFINSAEYIKQNQQGLFSASAIVIWIQSIAMLVVLGILTHTLKEAIRDMRERKQLEERLRKGIHGTSS